MTERGAVNNPCGFVPDSGPGKGPAPLSQTTTKKKLSKHRLAHTHFKGLDELMKMQPIIFKNIHNYAKVCIIMQNMHLKKTKHRLVHTHFNGVDELMKMQPIIFLNMHNYAKLCIIMQNMQVFSFLSKHRLVHTPFKALVKLIMYNARTL